VRRLAHATVAVVLLLAVVTALIVPILYWNGGLIEIESTQFVRQYLDDRTTLRKVFDPHGNDLGTYQARELSYFVDYLDARFFESVMLVDRPLFVPASALVAAVLTILLFVLAIRRIPVPARLSVVLVLLVYVTNYVHLVTTGMLYRSSKPLLAPVLIAAVFYLFTILNERPEARGTASWRRRSAPLIVFALFSVMSLLDRQGFFYAVAGAIAISVHGVVVGGRRDVLVAGLVAVGAMVLYNLMLAPMLVRALNGYSPSFAYQKIPWSLVADPDLLRRSLALVIQSLATLFGGAPPPVFAVMFSVVVLWMLFTRRKLAALAILAVCAVQTLLLVLLIARHPPIYGYYDHRVWYYPLPFQALVVALLVVAIGRGAVASSSLRSTAVSVILVCISIANVTRWDNYLRSQMRSMWFPAVYTQNLALKESFRDGRARPALSPEYFAFFEFWRERAPALRDRAGRGSGHREIKRP
jgi:hypothetical protein